MTEALSSLNCRNVWFGCRSRAFRNNISAMLLLLLCSLLTDVVLVRAPQHQKLITSLDRGRTLERYAKADCHGLLRRPEAGGSCCSHLLGSGVATFYLFRKRGWWCCFARAHRNLGTPTFLIYGFGFPINDSRFQHFSINYKKVNLVANASAAAMFGRRPTFHYLVVCQNLLPTCEGPLGSVLTQGSPTERAVALRF